MLKFIKKTYLYLLALPLLFTALGTVSNQVVFWANEDKFPVKLNDYKLARHELALEQELAAADTPEEAVHAQFDLAAFRAEGFIDERHVIMTEKTHFNWLADIWDFKDEGSFSIGDLSLDLGSWLWIFTPAMWAGLITRKAYSV